MRSLNARNFAKAILLLCPLARHAAAAPPPPTTLAVPTPTATSLAVPPSEPILQLARPTLSPDLEADFKIEVEGQEEQELDLRAVTTVAAAAPAAPAITAPPEGDTSGGEWWHTGVDGNGDTFRYRQTTYYTCVTQGLKEHCGWHRPILEVSGAGGLGEPGRAFGVGGRAMVVGLLAGGFAYLLGR
ncbi:hypothetical protein B0T16DRAFT_388223 [Cercophora newfieldiana]|uniref:Uncharacterized protein n=1 Tax=Cercophora newfieldiana TaxID=92897 RepID=A0AA39YL96_9PEZI|nr:hypothetical protein B0T16DRAFT_388223 [Cercophora newfieldiana]